MYMAKAIAAFTGTTITTLFAAHVIPTIGVWYTVLTVASILATAVTTYAVPNADVDRTVQ